MFSSDTLKADAWGRSMNVDWCHGSAEEMGTTGAFVCSTGTRPAHQTSITDSAQISLGEGVEPRLKGMEISQETTESSLMF